MPGMGGLPDDLMKDAVQPGGEKKGFTDYLSMIKNPVILALLGIMGNQQNKKAAADVYTPRQAMAGINDLSKNPYTAQYQSALSGTPASATTQNVMNAVDNRRNQQFNTPTLNLPERYNPYAKNPNYGNVNPELLASVLGNVKSTVTPENRTWMNNNLQNRGSTEARGAMLSNLQNRGTPGVNSALEANLANRGNDPMFSAMYNRYAGRMGATPPAPQPTPQPQPKPTPQPQPSYPGNMPSTSNPGLPQNLSPVPRQYPGNMPSANNPGLPANVSPVNGNMPSSSMPGLPIELIKLLLAQQRGAV